MAQIDDTNTLVYGVFNDVDIRSEARSDELTTEFTQVTLDGKHAFSDAFNAATRWSASPKRTTTTRCRPRCCSTRSTSMATATTSATNSRLPLITYGTTRRHEPGHLDAHADPPAPAEHDQQLPDRRRSTSSGRRQRLVEAQGRSAVEELHLQVHRSAPLQRHDGQHRDDVSGAGHAPISQLQHARRSSAMASDLPAGSSHLLADART